MRDIVGTVKLAAKYFPESPETVSNVFWVEVGLRAEELFREGCSVAGAYGAIIKGLPERISAEDTAALLGIIVETWKRYRLEGGGDRIVRNGSRRNVSG